MRKERISILVLALLALATPSFAQSATGKSSHMEQMKAAAMDKSKDGTTEMLIANEKQVWDAINRNDMTTFGSFLADDQVYINDAGVHSRAETLSMLSGVPASAFALDDFKVVMIDKDAAIVTYRVTSKGMTGQGAKASESNINVDVGKSVQGGAMAGAQPTERDSTVWVKRNGKWLAIFHQDTMQHAQQ